MDGGGFVGMRSCKFQNRGVEFLELVRGRGMGECG